MGLRINQTTPGLGAARQANTTNKAVNKTLQTLASGLRINRAADDAAGLAVAESFQSQVRQATQESANLQSGINMIETASGAVGTQQQGVGRLQELAVQAANGTLNDNQRAAIQQEAQQVLDQIDATARDTEFNGMRLLDGSTGTVELGVEGGSAEVRMNPSRTSDLGLSGLDLTSQAGAQTAIEALGKASASLKFESASLGAQQNGLIQAVEVRQQSVLDSSEAESQIRDVDMARAVMEKTRQETLLQGSFGAIVQSNIAPQMAARLLGQ